MSKQTETAIGAALAAKGITARIVGLRTALALFRNNGGTYDEAAAELSAAYADDEGRFSSAGRTLSERAHAARMGSEGHMVGGDKIAQSLSADASQLDAANGQNSHADKAEQPLPDAATERSAGQQLRADKAVDSLPDASPHKLPGHARRGLEASRIANAERNKSLFDTVRLPGDDRAIGDVTWKELQGLARKHAEAYRLLSLIDGYGQPANPDAPVRDVIKESTLREFVEIARLSNVH